MSDKRGRFAVAVLDGQLYAVGGSTGSHDLSSVERYDSKREAWTHVKSLPFSCSGVGVSASIDAFCRACLTVNAVLQCTVPFAFGVLKIYLKICLNFFNKGLIL